MNAIGFELSRVSQRPSGREGQITFWFDHLNVAVKWDDGSTSSKLHLIADNLVCIA